MDTTLLLKKLNLENINPNDLMDQLSQLSERVLVTDCHKIWKAMLDGKFGYAASISQVIIDRTWEELNVGHWKDVDINLRYLYSFVSLVKATSLYGMNDIKNAVKACDMGLLLGAPIFDNILAGIAPKLQHMKSETKNIKRKGKIDEVEQLSSCHHHIEYEEPSSKKKSIISVVPTILPENCIKRISNPSLLTFQNEYMKKQTPMIITNSVSHWPAFNEHKWTLDYIKSVAGSRTVPVEIGDRYTSDDWTQKLITVSEFIDKYVACNDSMGYLAQHQLFDQIPQLKNDISVPDYCCLSEVDDEEVMINAWFGPMGTVSPLHYDPYHNLLAQVVGSKYIRLYNSTLSEEMYPHEGLMNNTSQVDVEIPDREMFPKFCDAPFVECVLNEGEMLYIPPQWWHYVRSVTTSFSVSFWWQ